ncbi:MAG: hypothetical protein IPJ65_13320 [Archangiaceae bacterium]|nr:hypothetical protein [Archangiaceae bacterium]
MNAKSITLMLSVLLAACGIEGQGADTELSPEDQAAQSSEALTSNAVPVYFNHTYGILPEPAVTAMQNSAWLKNNFIDVEVRTTVRPDMTYTGTYLNMRETYLEFFPEGTFGYPLGVSGIALGDEVTGGVDKLVSKWQAEFGASEASLDTVSRTINGVDVPWFRTADVHWSWVSDYTAFWAMEYFPNAGQTAPRTRHEERAARYAPGKLAQNVVAAIYGLPKSDRQNVRRTFKSAGMPVFGNDDHFVALTAVDHGTRRAYDVVPDADGRRGLLGLVIRMNRVERHSEQLGPARLETGIGGLPYAVLWFVAPTAADTAAARSLAQQQ